MPSDLQITNIRDLTNANSAISIASDGQVTINQNNPTIELGSNATFPDGHVLQVKSTIVTARNSTTNTDTSGTGADVGLNVTITPKKSGSHFLITCSVGIATTEGETWSLTLSRDGTKIGSGVDSGNRFGATASNVIVQTDPNSITTIGNQFLDSPSTTSAITYQIAVNNNSGSTRTLYINRTEDDTDAIGTIRGISTITVMEVLA